MATVFLDLLAVVGLILFIIGFGQASNVQSSAGGTSPADFVGIQWVPFWAQAIGTPFTLIAFILHAVIVYFEKLRRLTALKAIFAIIFTILLVWMLAIAGGVLVESSLQVYQGAEPQVDWNIMLAGSLLLTIFGGLALTTTMMSVYPEGDYE